MRTYHPRRASLALAPALLILAWAPTASALTITGIYGGTAAPGGTTGGGTITSIFNWAAAEWEALIPDNHTVTLNYDWGALGAPTIGLHQLTAEGGTPHRETAANLTFDDDGSQGTWFLDATPGNNSEYTFLSMFSADLGGGVMGTGNVYTGATGFAAGQLDLVSVMLHEIGHSLGLSSANDAFQAENGDLDVDVLSGLFAGAVIETRDGAHLDLSNSLMWPSTSGGTRTLISDADLIANCQISQFTQCLDGTTTPIPEPTASLLFGIGMLVTSVAIRRRG